MRNARGIAATLLTAFFIFAFLPKCDGQSLTSAQESQLTQIAAMFHRGSSQQEIVKAWENFFRSNPKANVNSALPYLKGEVQKKGAEEVQRAREHLASATKLQDSARNDLAAAKRRQGPEAQRSIKQLEAKLQTQGDDARLANVDLQEALQKQQQTVQMLSTISKLLNDTAMAVVRKIGG